MIALVASFGDEKQTKPNPTKGKQTNQVRMKVDQKYKKLVTCINIQKKSHLRNNFDKQNLHLTISE